VTLTIMPVTGDQPGLHRQMADLLVVGFAEHWPGSWDTPEAGLREVRDVLARGFALAAVDDRGRVVGWIGGLPEYDGNVWELHPLVVAPDRQRQGIGRMLVQAFERAVRERGALTIMLGTDDVDGMTSLSGIDLYDDPQAHIRNIRNLKGHPYSFYEKLGFVIVGVVPDANGRGKPDIIMAKRVDQPV
jgi:aminoglycoside 6'-N-acetyltransferase I